MRILLDTHVVLWWLADSPQLSDDIKSLIDTAPAVHLSAVSPWEAAVKQSLGTLQGPPDVAERMRDSQFLPLPVTAGHGVRAGRLPQHHRDPFDRILVAQAQIEGLTLLTRDKRIERYDVPVLTV